DERRLARAVRPEQPEQLARLDDEIDPIEGHDRCGLRLVDAPQGARLDGRRRSRGRVQGRHRPASASAEPVSAEPISAMAMASRAATPALWRMSASLAATERPCVNA